MDIPFIQLFRSPNSCYFLDVNSNEIVSITEASFLYLSSIINHEEEQIYPITPEIETLKSLGYLATESAVKQVRHVYSDYLHFFLERKLSKITLQVTQNCNFRCKYCVYSEDSNVHQRNHSSAHMTWSTAKKAINFLWEHSVDSQDINVGFYGGEPLLEFPLIQKVVEYSLCRFRGKKLSFTITSNGSLLNDDIIQYFYKHDISLVISLDGPRVIHDQNRVFANGRGTFDTIIENLNRVKEIAPEYGKKISISMVMDPINDFDCINSICISGAELDTLSILPTLVDLGYDNGQLEFSEEYLWKYRYQQFLSILSHLGRFPKDDLSPIANSSVIASISACSKFFVAPGLRAVDAPGGPCIPGQLRLFVNAFEQLFPCERVSEKSSALNIGTLDNGFNYENVYKILNIGSLTENVCRNCWCFRFCTMCAKKADDETSSLSARAKLSSCEEVKNDVYSKICQYLLLYEVSKYYPFQVAISSESECQI